MLLRPCVLLMVHLLGVWDLQAAFAEVWSREKIFLLLVVYEWFGWEKLLQRIEC